ncbi:ergothioneine biosynthesis protein EgtB [Arcticibacterium luteifluviistationis]|uniref:Ergothioneine biosynthesis protein EgtB n=1 Tax=Arcticibacterium luteifluviistationis TaxID=1784714 RepID=A0A2Z4GF93_9BACT|nr:ergothioneine biosynthesis protein EgtB [Arcticibacterium luteifluviistationis]AWW00050.1 ergothioneine biosynthesis protein EgtB [Arcticibacterium luteifluviistationis]
MSPVLEKFLKIRNHTEKICVNLEIEDYLPQSAEFASPPKWHLAHTTWFFEEMILQKFVKDYTVFDKSYRFLFNSYYNSIGERLNRGERGLITRPSVEMVYKYRAVVNKQMELLLQENDSEEVMELVILGINHEQQHQELLLTDLKYTFSRNPTYPEWQKEPLVSSNNQSESWLKVSEGVYEIGFDGSGFSFDNELGRHKVYLNDFEIANSLVTNGDFIEFINDGGYQKSEFWLYEGWAWVNANKVEKPLYWYKAEGKWLNYTLAGLKEVNSDDVLAHVSFYEAAAYALWKGCRLPTEFEWEIASEAFEWGTRWEWTNSAYLPYPKYEIAAGAVGEYNGKFMINQMVLKGASVATSEGHSRKTYRNFFHPQMQWQFSGIRLAK